VDGEAEAVTTADARGPEIIVEGLPFGSRIALAPPSTPPSPQATIPRTSHPPRIERTMAGTYPEHAEKAHGSGPFGC
jgi:hypothetical protein